MQHSNKDKTPVKTTDFHLKTNKQCFVLERKEMFRRHTQESLQAERELQLSMVKPEVQDTVLSHIHCETHKSFHAHVDGPN